MMMGLGGCGIQPVRGAAVGGEDGDAVVLAER